MVTDAKISTSAALVDIFVSVTKLSRVSAPRHTRLPAALIFTRLVLPG